MLGVMFGVSDETAKKYHFEVLDVYMESIVPRLFYLPLEKDMKRYIPARFAQRFPNARLIGDGTHFTIDNPQCFALQGLTFSVYKWGNTFQMVLCKFSLHSIAPNSCNTTCFSLDPVNLFLTKNHNSHYS